VTSRSYFAGRWVAQQARKDGCCQVDTHVDTISTSGGAAVAEPDSGAIDAESRASGKAGSRKREDRRIAGFESQPAASSLTSKYHNEKTDGYDSKREAKRAAELRLLERAGVIRKLREQVPYLLIPAQYDNNGVLLERRCYYVADFVFEEAPDWTTVVLDVKGVRTDVYIIKRKLMLMVHNVRIREE